MKFLQLIIFVFYLDWTACEFIFDEVDYIEPYEDCIFEESEINGLHDLYNSTHGANWLTLDNYFEGPVWNFSIPYPNPCYPHWQGLYCEYTQEIDPSASNDSCTIVILFLNSMNLTGTLPESLGALTNLFSLQLANNSLHGKIPQSIGDYPRLDSLILADNYLTGTIPETIGKLNNSVLSIMLYKNHLTGTIPTCLLTEFGVLRDFWVFNNSLSGTLPFFIAPELVDFEIDFNLFEGTISTTICDNELIDFLGFSYNMFTGQIPDCSFEYLYWIDFSYNDFSGTMPVALQESEYIIDLIYAYNHLTGTIPPINNELDIIYIIILNDNILSGSIPVINDAVLFLYLQNNVLSGSISFTTEAANISLAFLDVTNNILTGSLPPDLFTASTALVSLGATSNCITGTLPPELCSMPELLYLGLDGLSTAKPCRFPIFPGISSSTSFTLSKQITGGIPDCLFNMPKLQTLHLSGNSIDWSFPSNLTISNKLVAMTLSHNQLTGTIPSQVLLKQWNSLDLSYNKLIGTINPDISLPVSSSLVLQVNRLSGDIPGSLMNLESINILTGNLFGCDMNRNSLPSNDQAVATYQCGSNSFNQVSIVWTCCATIAAWFLFLVYLLKYERWKPLLTWMTLLVDRLQQCFKEFEYNDQNQPLYKFGRFLYTIRDCAIYVTILLLVVFLPLYGVLTDYFKTAHYQYAWTVSAAFLSGSTPAVILLVFYLLFVLVLFGLWFNITNKSKSTSTSVDNNDSMFLFNWKQILSLSSVVTINCVVMSLVNVAYVIVIINNGSQVIFFAQIAIALFKLLWNDFAVRGMILIARRVYQNVNEDELLRDTIANNEVVVNGGVANSIDDFYVLQEMPYMTFMVLFNSIIAPCLATAAVDSNCFYNIFVASKPVTSQFPVTSCLFETTLCNNITTNVIYANLDISYNPPFIYSYQCTSTMLTNYASVYVFMYLIVAFLKPLTLWSMVRFYSRIPKGSCLRIFIDNTVYILLKPPSEKLLKYDKLFYREMLVLRLLGKIAVFVTFGVIFPPIAAVLCVAFITETHVNLVIMGRFLVRVKDLTLYNQFKMQLSKDVQGCMDLLLIPLVRLVIPFAVLFYGFFVFDIYGDKNGFAEAIWAPILLGCWPLIIWVGYSGYSCYIKRNEKVNDGAIDEGEMKEVELLNVNNVLIEQMNNKDKNEVSSCKETV